MRDIDRDLDLTQRTLAIECNVTADAVDREIRDLLIRTGAGALVLRGVVVAQDQRPFVQAAAVDWSQVPNAERPLPVNRLAKERLQDLVVHVRHFQPEVVQATSLPRCSTTLVLSGDSSSTTGSPR